MTTTQTKARFATLVAPAKSLLKAAAVLSAIGMGSLSSATAAPITIPNWSFEDPVAPTNSVTGWSSPDWYAPVGNLGLLVNGNGTVFGYDVPDAEPFGVQALVLIQGNSAAIDLNFLDAGLYELSFYIAGRANGSGNASYSVSIGDLNYTGSTVTAQPFTLITQEFSVATPGTYQLAFYNNSASDQTAYLDGVQIESIPEPSTVALMGVGLFAACYLARRKVRA